MQQRLEEITTQLFRRGYTSAGIAYVFGLLAEEHAPNSPEWAEYMKAREEYLHR